VAIGDEPQFDRRSSDRYLQQIERQVTDLRERVDILDRHGSRGHEVLVQRVNDDAERRTLLVQANEREHEAIRDTVKTVQRSVSHLGKEVEEVRDRVFTMEKAQAGRINWREGALRIVGPYAGFLGLLVTLYYTVRHG
jgi:biopolymer transport protein ExbB/TolQ